MKKIGRPRKTHRKENISVNLPKHLIEQINDKLSWKSSRSEWIESAIRAKLGDNGLSLGEAPTKVIFSSLTVRKDVSEFIKRALQHELNKIQEQEIKELEEKVGWKS